MFGVPSVCGTQSRLSCGSGRSSSAPLTAGSLSFLSLALIVAMLPPRRISAERRHASLNAAVLCEAPREEPFAVERAVRVVGLVHLGHQPHVDRLARLVDALVERAAGSRRPRRGRSRAARSPRGCRSSARSRCAASAARPPARRSGTCTRWAAFQYVKKPNTAGFLPTSSLNLSTEFEPVRPGEHLPGRRPEHLSLRRRGEHREQDEERAADERIAGTFSGTGRAVKRDTGLSMRRATREGTALIAAGCLPFAVGALVSRDGAALDAAVPVPDVDRAAVPAVRRDARVRLGRARRLRLSRLQRVLGASWRSR